ncbi:sarcosine oxidase subunit delta [Rhizobiaceae bacterium n13]|uniref:Sarcosine oxidase subunit delta n=1 Tax=Ferirhizobium litorale TaxID=2927786 RepID=A0AAE3U1Y5_9HYPH|nr:sarcosine oxidase subunit delta [Fererhizobium litorale]MDI7860655.1 sarcosine oxidase subunit delta [Fererhizobium litorale]MDI7920803.1 sarcosine oxidase subunit delta [Fererhizobium litorale]
MASLIKCPHCGVRPREEFSVRGDASVVRPSPAASDEEWHRYVHIRENPRGPYREHWQHAAGCRRWLVVHRNNVTHEVYDVMDAATVAKEVAQ